MIKEGSENKPALLILLIFYFKKITKIKPFIELKQLKMGENLIMKYYFFLKYRWIRLLAPLEIFISKISLKYIPIHIYNLSTPGDYEHETIQPWLPVSQKYK